jgi:DNA modification methylase
MIHQRYIIDNAKNVKKIFEKEQLPSPQLILSSPPYFDLLNYDDHKDQIGFGHKSYDDYVNLICKVFQDCYDISASNATFWLVVDAFKKNQEVKLFPFDIVNKLKETSKKTWILKDIIIWDKGKNLPWNSNGNFKNQHEYILFFAKDNKFKFHVDRIREILDLKKWWKTYPERYNPDGKAPSNIWQFNTPMRGWGNGKQNHLCPFPFPLVEKILSLCSDEGDWVLDPFAGSGSVLAISKEMSRNSIGIDVNSEYKTRFKDEVIVGAKKYWDNRVKELEEARLFVDDFKQTNRKLRKLKVASNICNHITKLNNHPFVFFTKNRSENNIDIIVLQNGRVPKIELKNEELQALIKQAKVNPKVIVQKDDEFVRSMNGSRSYKYKLEKFYSYTSTCKMATVIDNRDKYEYMYSDIAIKISNS